VHDRLKDRLEVITVTYRAHLFRLLFAIVLGLGPGLALAEESAPTSSPEVEIHLDLTRQFYEALRKAEGAHARTLSTERSDLYLEQIAISTRFMVETNLRLLEQQAEIKTLLRELLKASGE
jgi:hypothetical protein